MYIEKTVVNTAKVKGNVYRNINTAKVHGQCIKSYKHI